MAIGQGQNAGQESRESARTKRIADWAARLAATLIIIVGLALFWPIWQAKTHPNGETERTRVTTVESTHNHSKSRSSRTKIRKLAPHDFLGGLTNAEGILVLAHIGLVVLSSFVVGAITQRVFLANFAIKVGPVSIPGIDSVEEDEAGLLLRALASSVRRTGS